MRMKRQKLEPGYVLADDVYVNTPRPIMEKGTVLKELHLKVLEAFFIDEVMVEGQPKEVEKSQSNDEMELPQSTFIKRYLNAVKGYQQCFSDWQKGEKVDIFKLRKHLIPILEEAIQQPDEILSMHLYVVSSDYLYHHAVSTSILSAFLARKRGYEKGEWIQIGLAGALCDAGLAKVSMSFLKNTGPPTYKEKEEISQHPIYGYQMLKNVSAVKEGVRLAVSQHHEREDGSGYPLHIQGDQIHPYSKIVAVADSFHAMTCDRPYRKRRSPFQTIEVMKEDQFGRYDVSALQVLSDMLVRLSIGTKVRLTNDKLGEIVFIPPTRPTRPIVKMTENGEIVALANRNDLFVDSILT